MIFHIAPKTEWLAAQARGAYLAPSLQSEGFIHCSKAEQVVPVANAFYRGRSGLALLAIDETKLTAELKWEPPAGLPAAGISESDFFPHVYGALNLSAVVEVRDFSPNPESGLFSFPEK